MKFYPKTYKCVINLHKRLYGSKFKQRPAKAIKQIKNFVMNTFLADKIRIDHNLNKIIWERGSKNNPNRIRLLVSKDINILEDGNRQSIAFVRLNQSNSSN